MSAICTDQETKILGNYTVLTDRLVLESSKFVWEGESCVNSSAALLNSQYSWTTENTLEKFEYAALFLRLGLPSTLIRHENGAF